MCTFQSLSSFSHQDVWIPRERNGIAYEHPLACQTLFEFDQIFFVNYIHDIYINVWETETFKSQGNSASSKNCQGWAQASVRFCIKLLLEVGIHFLPDGLHLSSKIVQGLGHVLKSLHEQPTVLVRLSGYAGDSRDPGDSRHRGSLSLVDSQAGSRSCNALKPWINVKIHHTRCKKCKCCCPCTKSLLVQTYQS